MICLKLAEERLCRRSDDFIGVFAETGVLDGQQWTVGVDDSDAYVRNIVGSSRAWPRRSAWRSGTGGLAPELSAHEFERARRSGVREVDRDIDSLRRHPPNGRRAAKESSEEIGVGMDLFDTDEHAAVLASKLHTPELDAAEGDP
jgi:hypothetical protein